MTEIITANEAATRLQIHLITLYRWVSAGRLVAERLPNGRLRIKAKEVEKLIDGIAKGRLCKAKKSKA